MQSYIAWTLVTAKLLGSNLRSPVARQGPGTNGDLCPRGVNEPFAQEQETVPVGGSLPDHTVGRSRKGQSPSPGSRGLNPLLVHLPEKGTCGLMLIPVC
jgi:hypothetical protein